VNGNLDVLKWFYAMGYIDPKAKDRHGFNLAHEAAAFRLTPVMQWLHSMGFLDPQERNNAGNNVAHLAVHDGELDMLRWMGLVDPHARGSNGRSLAHLAAELGHVKLLEWLHSVGFLDLDAKDHLGRNIDDIACANEAVKVRISSVSKCLSFLQTPSPFEWSI